MVELPRVKKKYKGESEHQMAQREAETALSAVRMAHKAAQDSVRFAPNWNHHSAQIVMCLPIGSWIHVSCHW